MSAKSNRQRRKRKEGSRKANDRILIIAQGSVTEIEYFNELKSLYRLPGIQIINESHSPENIVKKSKNAISREEFDKVYFVVDVDASS
ncbi:RloB domain-containing protein, partial [Corynebacterium striatum]|nr:RloB domain-containing protein [Corynebacterium striatum]